MKKIKTNQAPEAFGHYEQGIVSNGFVFTSMQLPFNPQNIDAPLGDVRAQARQALKNAIAIVEAAGGSRETIVQMRLYLADMDHWGAANEAYTEIMGEAKPARSVVAVAALHHGCSIAVEGVAQI